VITIHCGLHKTGSSSIRRVLGTQPVARGGIRFHGDGGLIERDGHLLLSKGVTNSRLQRDLRRGRDVLLVSPNFLGFPWDTYENAAENLASTNQLLRQWGPVRFVLYVRPQHSWVESCVAQYVQQGGTRSPEDVARRITSGSNIRFSALIREVTAAVPTSMVVVRSAAGADFDSVRDFLPLLDVSDHRSLPGVPGRRNVSLGVGGLSAMLKLNAELEPISRQQVRRLGQTKHTTVGTDKHSLLSLELREELRQIAIDDWWEIADLPLTEGSTPAEEFRNTAIQLKELSLPPVAQGAELLLLENSAALGLLAAAAEDLHGQLGRLTPFGSFVHRAVYKARFERPLLASAIRTSLRERWARLRHR